MLTVVDFETTGLLQAGRDWSVQPGIVQIGAVKLDAGLNEIGVFSSLINPEIAAGGWSDKAIETTGIGPEHVAKAPTFFEKFPEFAEFMLGSRAWIGWNNNFDVKVLKHQLERYGFETIFPWPINQLDGMKLTTAHLELQGKRGMKWPKLGEAYEAVLKKKMKNAHDAIADVRAVAEIMRVVGVDELKRISR